MTIIVTDECPGGYCANGRTHFDLSGAAFGRMAINGESAQLRNRGELPVVYRRYAVCLALYHVLIPWFLRRSFFFIVTSILSLFLSFFLGFILGLIPLLLLLLRSLVTFL